MEPTLYEDYIIQSQPYVQSNWALASVCIRSFLYYMFCVWLHMLD